MHEDSRRPSKSRAQAGRDPSSAAVAALPEAPWLLRHRVELPDPIEGYVARPAVEQRCALMNRRLTVLHAPGGFGKTALLGRCGRELREQGVVVAWVSFDEKDEPESVATYLTLAFERAGLQTFVPSGEGGGHDTAQVSDAEADSPADYRINLLVRALERHAAPCVLALDEVERLRDSQAIAAVNAFLVRAPRNLHLGMAFRERPPGLEIAMFELEGRGATVTVEELRFSPPDISRFFDQRLSRRQLAAVVADSAGWPIALHIYRNAGRDGPGIVGNCGRGDTIAGWIETRLWRGISAQDREFVFDVALFDWIDPVLIEEATGADNAGRRIASMAALAGLLSTMGGSATAMRLHPLIKDYCEKRHFAEAPDRFRAIHRGIARALARRGRVVEALRHAGEAGDTELLGRIAESTGGVRLWLEQGLQVLRTVDGLLTAEVLSAYPRMALVRCLVLIASGDIEGAKRVHRTTGEETSGFTCDREGGDDRALQIEHLIVQGLMHVCGCRPYGGRITDLLPIAEAVAVGPDTDPLLRGIFSLGMCMAYNQLTAFDLAIEWAGRARAEFGRGSPYLAHIDLQVGSVAMAKGRTREARDCYDRAMKIAKASHLRDAGAVMIGQVLAAELELERRVDPTRMDSVRISPRLLGECGAWFDVYAANVEVGAELALLHGGLQTALTLVEDAREYARRTERTTLVRFLSALRISVMLAGGQVDEAGRAWHFDRLPEKAADCTDLETQSWRGAEMLAGARLRLLMERGEFDPARELAAALRAVAEERGLVRTSMRSLALSMVLEHRAGRTARAQGFLVDYLRLFAKADYVRPLVRDRVLSLALLDDVADTRNVHAALRHAALGLHAIMADKSHAGKAPLPRALSHGELEVLVRLERHPDKEIARDLSLSYDGVRYRIRGIFAKLGVRGRLDAVQRARVQGILPPVEDASKADP